MDRYKRNYGTITEEGQKLLHSKKVLVIGAGGLGGFVIEGLARMGIKNIGICDCDVFDESNLNRQLFSTEEVIGQPKVEVAKKRVHSIDKTINVALYNERFPNADIDNDIEFYDIVIDCLDSIDSRLKLEKLCVKHDKKLIHGGVGGYYGTMAVISKENRIIENLLKYDPIESTVEKSMGNPYSIVSIVGAFQVHLCLAVLLGRNYLKNGIYYLDIESCFQIEKIPFHAVD